MPLSKKDAQIDVFRELVVLLSDSPMTEKEFLEGFEGLPDEPLFFSAFAELKSLGVIETGADGFLFFPEPREVKHAANS